MNKNRRPVRLPYSAQRQSSRGVAEPTTHTCTTKICIYSNIYLGEQLFDFCNTRTSVQVNICSIIVNTRILVLLLYYIISTNICSIFVIHKYYTIVLMQ